MGRIKEIEYITLGRATELVYELTGVTRQRCTVCKWVEIGRIAAKHGTKVKLRTTHRLGRLYTTRAWLKKFIEEVG